MKLEMRRACTTMEEDRDLSVIIRLWNLFLSKTNAGADRLQISFKVGGAGGQ